MSSHLTENLLINSSVTRHGDERAHDKPNNKMEFRDIKEEEEDPTLAYERWRLEKKISLVSINSKTTTLENTEQSTFRQKAQKSLYAKYKAQLHKNTPCQPAILSLFNPYDLLFLPEFENYGSQDADNAAIWREVELEKKDNQIGGDARGKGNGAGSQTKTPKVDTLTHKQQVSAVVQRFENKFKSPDDYANWLYVKKPKYQFAEYLLRKLRHKWLDGISPCLAQCLVTLYLEHERMERVNVAGLALTQYPEGYVIGSIFKSLFEATFRMDYDEVADNMRRKYALGARHGFSQKLTDTKPVKRVEQD